ncbi:MAG: ZIP family metal transporter, partial [Candidatus Bilamarchaeaceae archaeon]
LYALVAFAAGSLLGGAFFHLLPESLETLEVEPVLLLSLSGFTLFLLLEAYLHWHSCKDCKIHPFSYMMMIGDGIHNFLGGIVLAASFLMSIPLGIATIIAIIAHEFPQQLGIFGVLVKGGFERKKAILYSFLAQSTIIGGALAGYLVSNAYSWVTAILVPFAAGNFIYIAAADLIPEMHRTEGMEKIRMIVFFMLGLGFMWWVKAALGV